MNCDTSELLPTAVSPNMSTLCEKCDESSVFNSGFCFGVVTAAYLYGPLPGLEVLLSRLDAKLHVADVRAELPGLVAVKCSVLNGNDNPNGVECVEWVAIFFSNLIYLEFELATLLLERLRRDFSESPRLTTPLPVIEKCRRR